MRQIQSFNVANILNFTEKFITWANSFETFAFYNSNNDKINAESNFLKPEFNFVAGTEKLNEFILKDKGKKSLKTFLDKKNDWYFGFYSYDYKNYLEKLKSENFDGINLPDIYFFNPKLVYKLKNNNFEIHFIEKLHSKQTINKIYTEIISQKLQPENKNFKLNIKQRISKNRYLEKINTVKEHIKLGDIYEANFCMEFYDENAKINPLKTYIKLNTISPTPFSAYFKLKNKYLLSASPERYIKKKGLNIISQPIKGTAARNSDKNADLQNKINLENDPKERAENIMIVDLVRNDLSRTAAIGSVKVDELCKIYGFKQVYQMISTISSTLKTANLYCDVIDKSFPPGSMTGAPKISAMQIIEELEETKRGLYSGAVGYFTPEKDFDFNVVIRSILYNTESNYLSYSVGGAITDKSISEKEYDECLLKAKAMKEVLNS